MKLPLLGFFFVIINSAYHTTSAEDNFILEGTSVGNRLQEVYGSKQGNYRRLNLPVPKI